ncbi:MAG: PEP-CTERM sorting domain-containing protein [Desulfuromonadaceae bacterium]|nr:PEP-CTERM sorting domain-containing protein [Desulfuromonadaceae bacterium]
MRKKMVALLAGAMMMLATSAMATPITALELTATGAASPVTILDGGSGDISSTTGIVAWAGNLGNFMFNIAAGSTAPAIGSAADPQMHLTGYANSGASAGTFTVKFSSTDFGPMGNGLNGFISAMNGAGGVQSLDVFYDAGNALFATTTQIANINTINTFDIYNGIPASNPFSLTMIATMTVNPYSAASFDNTVAPVPEPGTMMLLGMGMLGMAVYGKRRMNKEA